MKAKALHTRLRLFYSFSAFAQLCKRLRSGRTLEIRNWELGIGRCGAVNIEDASTLFEDSVIFRAFGIVRVVA
jgi:hypothetical protein